MKKSAIIFSLSVATIALSAQSVNANFEVDEQGWTSHFLGIFETNETTIGSEGQEHPSRRISNEPLIQWSKIIRPLNDRGAISFYGKNYNSGRDDISIVEDNFSADLFLFIQKEITGLLPNTNYRVVFNLDWICQLHLSASPITIKVGAVNKEPMLKATSIELSDAKNYDIITGLFDKGEIGRDGLDFIVAGRLPPNEFGRPFHQNLHNFDNAFLVNTDESGRLFLMIGVEPETDNDVENVFLNTLRIVLAENGGAREISNIYSPSVELVPNAENNMIFFKSEYNDEIEMVNIYTEDNLLIKIFSFRDPSVERAFQITNLTSGTYRIEFVLNDGRTINKFYTVE
jgi:hypothetical protein